jgi:hypothetical protein
MLTSERLVTFLCVFDEVKEHGYPTAYQRMQIITGARKQMKQRL